MAVVLKGIMVFPSMGIDKIWLKTTQFAQTFQNLPKIFGGCFVLYLGYLLCHQYKTWVLQPRFLQSLKQFIFKHGIIENVYLNAIKSICHGICNECFDGFGFTSPIGI